MTSNPMQGIKSKSSNRWYQSAAFENIQY